MHRFQLGTFIARSAFFVGGSYLRSTPERTQHQVLGNADLSYKFHFYDGAVLPLGLGLSLILNGVFLARHMNRAELLTLPDLYGRAYGPLCEVLGACITITSFLALLAGNLVGCGVIVRLAALSACICVSLTARLSLRPYLKRWHRGVGHHHVALHSLRWYPFGGLL